MKKLLILALVLLFLPACSDSHRFLSGEVSDVRTEKGEIVSFVLTDENGKRTGVLIPEDGGIGLQIPVHRHEPGGVGRELLAVVRGQRGFSAVVLHMDGGPRPA